jgi:hypothetical protein
MVMSEMTRSVLRLGSVKIRVSRSGMLQQLTFTVRRTTEGNITYTELFTNRIVDVSELLKVANETGLPVSAPNGHAFPAGTSAIDFSKPEYLPASETAGK